MHAPARNTDERDHTLPILPNDPVLFEPLVCGQTIGATHDDDDLQFIVHGFVQRFPEGISQREFGDLIDIMDLGKFTLNLP